ncbi:MAG: hypothetical protein ACOC4E_00045 [Patescibacteria group bacterium]
MAQKWNLQDIRPPESRQPRRRPASAPTGQPEQEQDREPDSAAAYYDNSSGGTIPVENGVRNRRTRLVWGIAVFVFIVVGAVGISSLLGESEVTVYPHHREPNVNAEFTAYPDARDDALNYEIMTLEATAEDQVTASGQVEVQEQATGVIEIVNTTSGAERLIKNTRFRSPSGLIYRIEESVVVPGAVTDSSGASVPGTTQAEVFADDIGEEYNLPAGTTFNIPGYEEGGFTELFESITARNPEPIEGGYDGPQFQIAEDELSTARQSLQISLRDQLLERIESEKPAGFIAFPGAVAITYNQLPPVEHDQDLVTIREEAILQIPLFAVTELGSFLAAETVPTYEGNPVRLDNPDDLTFTYTNATTSASIIANEPSLSFTLVGRPLLIWDYDEEQFLTDIAGRHKTAVQNVIGGYPGISAAKVDLNPFWRRTFPENTSEITLVEELREPTDTQ